LFSGNQLSVHPIGQWCWPKPKPCDVSGGLPPFFNGSDRGVCYA
jgi:hypothetical protein